MDETSKLSGGSTRIDLRGIREGTHPVVLESGEAPLALDRKESRALRRFRFEGSLVWTVEDRRVRGFLSGTLETRCDRCLAAFDREMRSEVEVAIRVGAPSSGAESSAAGSDASSPDEEILVAAEAVELDLADTFRQTALLEVPLKNVCREDCAGLCPSCGVNLNEESCPHAEESRATGEGTGDPRWDALRHLSFGSKPEDEE
jgi:uncharacterized metal-binding protein YceD (DUF177 family)